MNIVLVDDDDAYRELTALALRDCGARDIREFDGPASALAALDQWKTSADLVLLDYHLPGATGLQLMRKLRFLGCGAPIAILSAADLDDARCLLDGALAVVKKPWGTGDLTQTLRTLTLQATRQRSSCAAA